jgi:hypothetical protein
MARRRTQSRLASRMVPLPQSGASLSVPNVAALPDSGRRRGDRPRLVRPPRKSLP